MTGHDRARRGLRAFRAFLAEQREIQERLMLINRPWEEEFLHWADGDALHGHLTPPADGRRRGVTSTGWCWCLAHRGAQPHAHPDAYPGADPDAEPIADPC